MDAAVVQVSKPLIEPQLKEDRKISDKKDNQEFQWRIEEDGIRELIQNIKEKKDDQHNLETECFGKWRQAVSVLAVISFIINIISLFSIFLNFSLSSL